jgi:hypothetical protein
LPHDPQLLSLSFRSTHSPEQFVSLAGHPVLWHAPSTHVSAPVQRPPHVPQLAGSVPMSTQPPAQEVVGAAQLSEAAIELELTFPHAEALSNAKSASPSHVRMRAC